MVNETALIQKYDKDIRRIVNRYLAKLQYSTKYYSYYDDLISEAQIVFLVACREFNLENDTLTLLQRAMIKKKIESALRVFVWKMHNMGGYNNRTMILDRCITISDVLVGTGLDLDEVVPLPYDEDFTPIETNDFIKSLERFDQKILRLVMDGEPVENIGRILNRNKKTIFQRLEKIRNLYLKRLQPAA